VRSSLRLNRYFLVSPSPKQAALLLVPQLEALYGGAAGGGKSIALFMAALQYVDYPEYRALLLRRTYADLRLPGALMDVGHRWLDGTDARWSPSEYAWHFPSGAQVRYGYLETELDRLRYQSTEWHFIGADELTQFTETQYRFLFSRLRRRRGSPIPLRMRGASNPGGPGHDWVKARFLDGRAEDRVFIPARVDDNPGLEREEYARTLGHLDPVSRRQYLDGDWTARHAGSMFRREWLPAVPGAPRMRRVVRYWDLAATEPKRTNDDPDYTVGVLAGLGEDGLTYIRDVQRFRLSPGSRDRRIAATAFSDGREVEIWEEHEPGASGVAQIAAHRQMLSAYAFRGDRKDVHTDVRASVLASHAEGGRVKVVAGPWNGEFWDELEAYPLGAHDDQVVAASGAYLKLTSGGGVMDYYRQEYEAQRGEAG
jgi:predicted phage terminase large subunit-like protein